MAFQKRSLLTKYIVGFVSGIVTGLLVTMVLTGILAMTLVNGNIPEEMMAYGAGVIAFVSGSLTALIAGVMIKKGWFPVCIGAGGMYFICLLIMAIMFFDGVVQNIPLTLLLAVIGPCVIGLTGIMKKRKPKFQYSKRHFR